MNRTAKPNRGDGEWTRLPRMRCQSRKERERRTELMLHVAPAWRKFAFTQRRPSTLSAWGTDVCRRLLQRMIPTLGCPGWAEQCPETQRSIIRAGHSASDVQVLTADLLKARERGSWCGFAVSS